jgi:hypothetical protein
MLPQGQRFRVKPKPDTLTYKPRVNRDIWTRHLEAVLGSAVPYTSQPLPVFTAMHASGSVLAYYENAVPATSQPSLIIMSTLPQTNTSRPWLSLDLN